MNLRRRTQPAPMPGQTARLVRPAPSDPDNRVDVFDRTCVNSLGGFQRIAAGILPSEVEDVWSKYVNLSPTDAGRRR